MPNDPHSLMHAGTGEDLPEPGTRAVSLAQLQSLQQDNTMLRTIVAELLLKNQALRWKLADHVGFDQIDLAKECP